MVSFVAFLVKRRDILFSELLLRHSLKTVIFRMRLNCFARLRSELSATVTRSPSRQKQMPITIQTHLYTYTSILYAQYTYKYMSNSSKNSVSYLENS